MDDRFRPEVMNVDVLYRYSELNMNLIKLIDHRPKGMSL